MQVKPTDVDKWSKVEFVSDGSPIPTSYIVVYIFADEKFAARISDFTADACIPRPRKYRVLFYSCVLDNVATVSSMVRSTKMYDFTVLSSNRG